MQILPNISRSKGNQPDNEIWSVNRKQQQEYFSSKTMQKQGRKTSSRALFFSKKLYIEVKASGLHLSFTISRQASICHTIKKEMCSNLTFHYRVYKQFLHHILFMVFQENCFPCYILFIEEISLSNCLYFLRYWATCVL